MTVTSPEFLDDLVTKANADGITGFVAAAMIIHDGRTLLVRRLPDDFMGGFWEVPSGKVEAGETILDGLRRETDEETGLTISQITSYIGHFDYSDSDGIGTTRQFNFAVTVEKAEPIILTEHDSFMWWAHPDELPQVSDEVRGVLIR
ncbi:NUDIX domain-containing protein [Kitasatospora sp. NPDC002227]|uniref:NUDIX domain-containing protein n=1 Tax=Kitasatospora sp. NPDC002227 TaxID=3154773 RepID=UPI00332B43EE